ncbi:hypothetical protein KY290_030369 [Solanum tuberosum]|uniref:ATP binding protein n=1 Tax=Solanum tuberosum TaxID=4113 RepID=A0ABQ7UND9_SOLTU|nr:hypothetical protein KY284_028461 [Solanum tuberosum]KAH0668248.1 hypothetical protein KY285_029454 [Solanum tuberosum]KAH0751137.1 hypothetical protein KY290_030369 [Solanum tuberosum]
MGGDTTSPHSTLIHSTEESSFELKFPDNPPSSSWFRSGSDLFGSKVENGEVGLGSMDLEEFFQASSDVIDEVNKKRIRNVYMDVLKSYEELQFHKDYLKEAKSKILSYTPGSWIEEVGGMKASDYNIPKKMTLLLIGPRGSGKSCLINKISRVFDDDPFTPERAQVSYSSDGDGTYFLHEYTMPKGSSSFCLYDTRGLSDDLNENKKIVDRWMTKGVRHGKLIMRDSDDAHPKSNVSRNRYCASETNVVNCVIFVVSAVQILQSMDSDDETKRQQTRAVATNFKYPLLSFKDEKPIVVLTHGDLLSLSDRTRIRMHLGQLLGIHPKKQIFDIPESDDFGTRLTILNMLRHCLEHADKNLPFKKDLPFKSPYSSKGALQMLAVRLLLTYAILAILFGMGMMFKNTLKAKVASVPDSQVSQSHMDIDWHATAVDSAPNLQPEAMQPHVKVECHASEVDSVRNLHPEAPQSDENLDCPASEVDTVRDLHPEADQSDENLDCHASEVDSVRNLDPEAPQSDEDLDWGAIRHLWSD